MKLAFEPLDSCLQVKAGFIFPLVIVVWQCGDTKASDTQSVIVVWQCRDTKASDTQSVILVWECGDTKASDPQTVIVVWQCGDTKASDTQSVTSFSLTFSVVAPSWSGGKIR